VVTWFSGLQSALSEGFEEGDDCVGWLVAAWQGALWRGSGQGAFFEREVGVLAIPSNRRDFRCSDLE
jgi:hypothetical protein